MHSIRWRIAFPYAGLILVVILGLGIYLSAFMQRIYLTNLEHQLLTEARLSADALAEMFAQGEENLDEQARQYAALTGARVTLIRPDGVVIGESHEDRTQMDNHLYRAEVQAALARGQGTSVRYSGTTHYEMMYVAVTALKNGEVVGIVRLALPLDQITASIARLRTMIVLGLVLAVAVAFLIALGIAEKITRPVRLLTAAVERVQAGDLGARILPTTTDEIGTLTQAFNQMAEQLQDTVARLEEEHDRLANVLEHMADGVLITDGEGRVRLTNPAALRLLAVSREDVVGRSFVEATRDHRLIELWEKCCKSAQKRFESVELRIHGRFLQAIVTPLEQAEPGACLIILQDLTQVRRAEAARRDLISNVSHELRTPLASLKALVETLRDSALEDPPAARRFLDRMESEVDALAQMVQELLELSRIESGQVPMRTQPESLADIVLPAVERLRPQAERAGLKMEVELPAELPRVQADRERTQQVVTNLVHNAIKFTPPGGMIHVRAYREGDRERFLEASKEFVVVEVRDTGIGISAEDLPRIFERFYRADRARSGGGTGLGLAIAKHIVQAHGGCIWAESTEGQGSTFRFTLPAVPEVTGLDS